MSMQQPSNMRQSIRSASTIRDSCCIEPRSLKFVGVSSQQEHLRNEEEVKSFVKLLRIICKTTLVVSALLFVAVAVSAACLCRPVLILGSLLVSLLFLGQGILCHNVLKATTQSILVGCSCLSGFLAVVSLASALFLLTGQYVVACISPLHTNSKTSMTQLYVIEVTTLIATVPLLVGSVTSLVSAVLTYTETQRSSMKKHEPQLFLYLQDSYKEDFCQGNVSNNTKSIQSNPTAPSQLETPAIPAHSSTPPPPYRRAHEESFA